MPRRKSEPGPAASRKSSEKVVEIDVPENTSPFITPIAIVISAVLVSITIIYTGSKLNTTGGEALGETDAETENTEGDAGGTEPTEVDAAVVRDYETFTEYDTEICKEDGKPVVYLFSTTWCPHCEWIKETFDQWAKDNAGSVIAYHWELDTYDNTLTDTAETDVPEEHTDVYEKFNPGGSIPTFVFGCRYARIGNGYEATDDLQKERESFDKILNELV